MFPNVTIASAATTDLNTDAYHNSITRIFQRKAETGRTENIIALIGKRS